MFLGISYFRLFTGFSQSLILGQAGRLRLGEGLNRRDACPASGRGTEPAGRLSGVLETDWIDPSPAPGQTRVPQVAFDCPGSAERALIHGSLIHFGFCLPGVGILKGYMNAFSAIKNYSSSP
ncbi:hypothetical protein [Kamptonema formosum]|uniref:hypothetical protein n=1 Tax=Kamptonema formosum TaxID=331992 RepID=UPI00034AC076|nr:hypothetical protein [Oscillatoria sp. PCC 10802]